MKKISRRQKQETLSSFDESTLYLVETPFNAIANRADPDQAALQGLLCLLMEVLLDMILH